MTYETIKPLEAYRKELVGCEIAVFMDISARTVLAWDGALKWPQEHLDNLCDLALRVLSVGSEGENANRPQTAILARPTGCFVFLRAAPGASEVLCCVFAPDADFHHSYDAGRHLCAVLLGAGHRMNA